MFFDVDLNQVRTLVEKAILGTIPAPERNTTTAPPGGCPGIGGRSPSNLIDFGNEQRPRCIAN